MQVTKELLINTGLAAFWVGAAIVAGSNQPLSKAVILAGVGGAIRFFIGAMALNAKQVPALPVDE